MKSILFLSAVMEQGWGVSLEIGEICRRLRPAARAFVGAQRVDDTFGWLRVETVAPDPRSVRQLAARLKVDVLAAHTSPFFEILPALAGDYETWAWENGDPTPAFFADSRRERTLQARHKRETIYPRVDRVVAISDFIRHDIEWPGADVVRLGGDHVPAMPAKTLADVGGSGSGAVRVGTLMRLGRGEASYKGNQLFLRLMEDVQKLGLRAEFHVAGRGTASDAASFRDRGVVPHLNLSDDDKVQYLRSLDIFVSMSLWEGFNLPLAEAQAVGTLALALDTGAHPELCPYLLGHPGDAIRYLLRAIEDRQWLIDASAGCASYIRRHYSWDSTAEQVRRLLAR